MKTATLKVIPVSELKPAEYNPRKKLKPGDKEYDKIKASIEEFGFADPLVVNADMTIIGGHQRLTVAMALGYTEVPCAVVDIDKVDMIIRFLPTCSIEDLMVDNIALCFVYAFKPYISTLRRYSVVINPYL